MRKVWSDCLKDLNAECMNEQHGRARRKPLDKREPPLTQCLGLSFSLWTINNLLVTIWQMTSTLTHCISIRWMTSCRNAPLAFASSTEEQMPPLGFSHTIAVMMALQERAATWPVPGMAKSERKKAKVDQRCWAIRVATDALLITVIHNNRPIKNLRCVFTHLNAFCSHVLCPSAMHINHYQYINSIKSCHHTWHDHTHWRDTLTQYMYINTS